MPMVPPLSHCPPKAAVSGGLVRERRQPPPPAGAFVLCAHQMAPCPHGRARCGDGEERQIERGGPALRLGDDGRREQREADDGVDGFSDGLHGGLLFLRCPRHASRRGRTGVPTARSSRPTAVQTAGDGHHRNAGALRPSVDRQRLAADGDLLQIRATPFPRRRADGALRRPAAVQTIGDDVGRNAGALRPLAYGQPFAADDDPPDVPSRAFSLSARRRRAPGSSRWTALRR